MNDYIFVVDTNAYAGNFEREMTAWIVGNDDYGEFETFGKDVESLEAHPELQDYYKEINTYQSSYVFDDDYGSQLCGIVVTPGWSNNGMGKHTKLKPGEARKCPAFMSVGIAVSTPELPEHILKTMKMLAEEFAENEGIKISGYRMLIIETITTEKQLEL